MKFLKVSVLALPHYLLYKSAEASKLPRKVTRLTQVRALQEGKSLCVSQGIFQ